MPTALAEYASEPLLDYRLWSWVLKEGEVAMIHSTVRMALPARQLNEVMGILAPMVQRIRAERGCVDCQLHQDVLEENVVILEEKWASQPDLERHIRSQDYRQLLLIMELAKARPEVRFDTVSGSTGFETIEKIRE